MAGGRFFGRTNQPLQFVAVINDATVNFRNRFPKRQGQKAATLLKGPSADFRHRNRYLYGRQARAIVESIFTDGRHGIDCTFIIDRFGYDNIAGIQNAIIVIVLSNRDPGRLVFIVQTVIQLPYFLGLRRQRPQGQQPKQAACKHPQQFNLFHRFMILVEVSLSSNGRGYASPPSKHNAPSRRTRRGRILNLPLQNYISISLQVFCGFFWESFEQAPKASKNRPAGPKHNSEERGLKSLADRNPEMEKPAINPEKRALFGRTKSFHLIILFFYICRRSGSLHWKPLKRLNI